MNKWILLLALMPAICPAGAPGPDSGWAFSEVDHPSGYGSMYIVSQAAGNAIRGESAGSEVTPVLAFGCSPGDDALTAYIDWQRFISSFSTEVGFKVDGGGFSWLKWKVDDSEKLTISPSADDSTQLIDKLGEGKELLVEVSPYSESPVTTTFELAGVEDALAELRTRCVQRK